MATEKRLINADLADSRLADDNSCGEKFPISWFRSWLALQETVDAVEVIHGEWRTKILCGGFAEEWGYVCSVCGCTVSDRSKLSFGKFATGNQKLNYCPNCGADMRERKDNVL